MSALTILAVFFCVFNTFRSVVVATKTIECAIGGNKIRSFRSLREYQSNLLSFDPEIEGNQVRFDTKSIDNIQKNTFITFDSDHIVKISLINKNVRRISDGAFNGLFCLHFLELQQNTIDVIARGAFEGLPNLQELNLSDNNLVEIADNTFSYLVKLKKLFLSRNIIRFVMPYAFLNLTNLEELHLDGNQIRTITSETMKPLKNLVLLDLSSNLLSEGVEEKWDDLEKLQVLNVANNSLKFFDTSYGFSFRNLKTLNISNNLLTELNVFSLHQNLPHLKYVDLNDNLWFCDDLASILHPLIQFNVTSIGRGRSQFSIQNVDCFSEETKNKPIQATSTEIITASSLKSTTINEDVLNLNTNEGKNSQKSDTGRNLTVVFIVVIFVIVVVALAVRAGLLQKLFCFRRRQRHYHDLSNSDDPLYFR